MSRKRYRSEVWNVEPRYSAGSPAAVDEGIALHVGEDEVEGYEHALAGSYGAAAQEKARQRGVALIVFLMMETAKNWVVFDLLTGEHHEWPFKGACPDCGRKNIPCHRGRLREHHVTRRWQQSGRCSGTERYIGRLMPADFTDWLYLNTPEFTRLADQARKVKTTQDRRQTILDQ